jgi:hypothetical protein
MRQNYERKQTYTIKEVLSKQIDPLGNYKSKENEVEFDGDLIKMDSHRYWVFKKKGTKCVSCGLKATFFAKECSRGKNNKYKSYHFNLYGINKNDEEILFTKDHIKPKSKGGIDHLDNYNTMCETCNSNKGDREYDAQINYASGTSSKRKKFIRKGIITIRGCYNFFLR